MLTKARNGSDEIIASARLTDLKAASERSKSEIIETLFDDPSLETIRAAFVRAPFYLMIKGIKWGMQELESLCMNRFLQQQELMVDSFSMMIKFTNI